MTRCATRLILKRILRATNIFRIFLPAMDKKDAARQGRYNSKAMQERQIDTLIGISKGMLADGIVSQEEAEFLQNWLGVNKAAVANNPLLEPLLIRIEKMLEDGVLDEKESKELLTCLQAFSGGPNADGELLLSTELPLDDPPPTVWFEKRRFVFTGRFAYGTRTEC